jgi:hypothetical protein
VVDRLQVELERRVGRVVLVAVAPSPTATTTSSSSSVVSFAAVTLGRWLLASLELKPTDRAGVSLHTTTSKKEGMSNLHHTTRD